MTRLHEEGARQDENGGRLARRGFSSRQCGASRTAASRAGGARGTPRGRSGGSGRCWRALARGSAAEARGERRALARGLGGFHAPESRFIA